MLLSTLQIFSILPAEKGGRMWGKGHCPTFFLFQPAPPPPPIASVVALKSGKVKGRGLPHNPLGKFPTKALLKQTRMS